jgi:nucleolar protein 56
VTEETDGGDDSGDPDPEGGPDGGVGDADPVERAWFEGVDPADPATLRAALRSGSAPAPADWPALAVETGVADDEEAYYDLLHETTVEATRSTVAERERADDRQLVHAVRAMDDADRVANELAERVLEWAGSLGLVEGEGRSAALAVADYDPEGPAEAAVVDLAGRVRDLEATATDLRAFVERAAPAVAPNLAAMAGPVLAARLISLSGGLGDLAKSPSSTVQVLGAEDALFAHLRGNASSPKHGVIFTHEFVRGTRRADRGSAARAFAAKLALAARADHYAGERRESLHADLASRMERIQARAEEDAGAADATDGDGA